MKLGPHLPVAPTSASVGPLPARPGPEDKPAGGRPACPRNRRAGGPTGNIPPAGGQASLAPSAAALGLSVGLGAALGAAAALWERYLLRSWRGFLLAFHRAPLGERLRWRYQKTNLLLSGWLLLAVLALVGWCVLSRTNVLPALFALNAVQFAANRRRAGRFNEELQSRAGD